MGVPEPGDRLEQHAVPRDQPGHEQVHQLHRQLEQSRLRYRAAQHRPERARRNTWRRTTEALAAQRTALGESIQRLPGFMRLANTTFVNLRRALDDLTPLVDVSKPVAPKLQQLLAQLQPLAQDAVPTVRELSNVVSRPGREQRPDRPDEARRAAGRGHRPPGPSQRQAATRRVPAVDDRAERFHPGAGDRTPVRRRRYRLVRGVLTSGDDRRQRRREPSRGDARCALGGRLRASELAPASATADRGRAAPHGPGRRADGVPGRPLPGIDRARRAVLSARAASRATRPRCPPDHEEDPHRHRDRSSRWSSSR